MGTIVITGRGLVARTLAPLKVLEVIAFPYILAVLFACLACPRAYGDVGVVLNESLDTSVDRITGTGHSAVYFSRICPESPVKLRLCGPGENGSVMSNYINIGEDQPFEWNVVPLNIYLYGVDDLRDRPIFGSFKLKHLLEERYRKNYLSEYCAGSPCRTSEKAEWREMIAATFIRSVYIFVIDTTVEQDLRFIEEFNAAPNKNDFNGFTRNCADFTSRVINAYFPHATHTDYLNDFGMTSPKAVARSFTRYARRHPELGFRVLHFAQVPGTIKRSSEVRAGTEQLYHSKKFLIPMIIFADHELPAVAASYLLTGRFNPEHEFEQRPAVEEVSAHQELPLLSLGEPANVAGTPEEWKQYRKAFDSLLANDVRDGFIHDRKDVNRFFKHLDETATPFLDDHGASWMETSENGQSVKIGLSAGNLLAQGSDPQLAYELLLARIDHVLRSPKHSRETMVEFSQDWDNLLQALSKPPVILAHEITRSDARRDTPSSPAGDD